ncbi:MAG TPA: PmoA family protein [Actinospica sp.]|nr:PmoA family protein [Actinospica sp.]
MTTTDELTSGLLTDDQDAAIVTARAAGRQLFKYSYRHPTDPFECPAPFFHPLRTLGGGVLTNHRPNDHRWHKGLAMTISHLSGQNFWGGGTYVPGAPGHGYVDLPNVGSLAHSEFESFDGTGFVEHVDWIAADGGRWIAERRSVAVLDVDPSDGRWTLEFGTELLNVSGRVLEIGSPTVFGRVLAGYSGFFWRGPRSFAGGSVLAAGGLEGPEVMGRQAPWLAYSGEFDVIDGHATLLFRAAPDTEGGDPHWFVRSEPFAAVNPSLAFHDSLDFEPNETLSRTYRITVADGLWDRERIESHLAEQSW